MQSFIQYATICCVLYVCTFSCLMSSFFTDLRLALRSMEPLCLEPRSALIISSADTRTFLRAGFLNFPPKSCTFNFSSWIFYRHTHTLLITETFSVSLEYLLYTYISVVFIDFGLKVISLLVHYVDFGMKLPTQFLDTCKNTHS